MHCTYRVNISRHGSGQGVVLSVAPAVLVCATAVLITLRFLSTDINRLTQTNANHSSVAHAVSSTGASGQGSSASSKSNMNARILIISAGEEQSEGYVSLMNCIFSAQKSVRLRLTPQSLWSPQRVISLPFSLQRIMIDVCKVSGGEAIFLQQAAHLTGGIYLRAQHSSALLQYLLVRSSLSNILFTSRLCTDTVPSHLSDVIPSCATDA